jgi:thiol:disulfide interchange protein
VAVLADWTDYNETIKQQLEELNSKSIPLLAIYPAKAPGQPIVLRDALVESQVLAALEEAGGSVGEGKSQLTRTSFSAE